MLIGEEEVMRPKNYFTHLLSIYMAKLLAV